MNSNDDKPYVHQTVAVWPLQERPLGGRKRDVGETRPSTAARDKARAKRRRHR